VKFVYWSAIANEAGRTYFCGMEQRYQDFIRDVLITIHMNLVELRQRKSFADPEEHTHIDAKILAYEEMLSILRDSAQEFNIPRAELGL
jgi:hypothetical protein